MSQNQVKDASLVAVITALALVVWQQQSTPELPVSHPPQERTLTKANPREIQRIDARLWEDPFAAVAKQLESDDKNSGRAPYETSAKIVGKQDVARWVDDRYQGSSGAQVDSDPRITLIGILRDASSHPDKQEQRRRDRVALQAAMSQVEASRIDGQHLGALRYKIGGTGVQVTVPFELFEKGKDENRKTFLVFWLDEDHFFDLPDPPFRRKKGNESSPVLLLKPVHDLFSDVVSSAHRKPDKDGRLDVRQMLLGPTNSSQLQKLVNNAILRGGPTETPSLIEVFSFSATTATKTLVGDILPGDCTWNKGVQAAQNDCERIMGIYLRPQGIALVRTILDDEVVMKSLVAELVRRANARVRYPWRDTDLTIVSLSSLGELYATELSKSIELAAGEVSKVVPYHFMQDLNEPQSASTFDGDRRGTTDASRSGQAATNTPSPAQGNKQFDYVTRLAEKIERDLDTKRPQDWRNWKHWAPSTPFAIGIMGAEPNDKITLVRAMKRRFPGAIFFTTDADARFLDRKDLAYTHNMLIGSAFDLELPGKDQGTFAPFRGSYQTAFYWSIFNALSDSTRTKLAAIDKDESRRVLQISPPLPVVAEVGLTKLVRLPAPNASKAGPSSPTIPFGPAFIFTLLGLATTAIAVKWVSPKVPSVAWLLPLRHGLGSRTRDQRTVLALGVLLVFALGSLAALAVVSVVETWAAGASFLGEPAEWNEGVSIWGVVAIRMLGCILAIVLLFRFLDIFLTDADRRRIGRRADIEGRPASADEQFQAAPREGEAVWRRYAERTTPSRTIVYAALCVVLLGVVMEILLHICGQPAEVARSKTSGSLYFWSGRVAAWMLFLLLAVCYRVFAECRRWMEDMAGSEDALRRVTWDARVRRRMVERHGLRIAFLECPDFRQLIDTAISMKDMELHTETICRFIYAPFIVLGVLLLSTWPGFEYFQWPLGAQILLGVVVAWAVYNAVRLELMARRVRHNVSSVVDHALPRLPEHIVSDDSQKRRIDRLVEDIRSTGGGAFAPLLEQPFLRALALPGFAGVAITCFDALRVT